MKTAIVTGSSGFIGKNLVGFLKKKNIRVFEISTRMQDYGTLPSLLSGEDLTEACVFYHLAWNGVYGDKRFDLKLQFENVLGAASAVKAAKELSCEAFIGAGSIMEREVSAILETGGVRPSPAYRYGEAKRIAHVAAQTEAYGSGIRFLWPIITNAYGEGDNSTRFIKTTMDKIAKGEKLAFTAGTQIYDFIHVEDIARALYLLGTCGISDTAYTISSGQPRPLRQFVEELCSITGAEPEFGSVPYSGVQLDGDCFSIDSLCRDTGFVPEIGFGEGIRRTAAWMGLKNERR